MSVKPKKVRRSPRIDEELHELTRKKAALLHQVHTIEADIALLEKYQRPRRSKAPIRRTKSE